MRCNFTLPTNTQTSPRAENHPAHTSTTNTIPSVCAPCVCFNRATPTIKNRNQHTTTPSTQPTTKQQQHCCSRSPAHNSATVWQSYKPHRVPRFSSSSLLVLPFGYPRGTDLVRHAAPGPGPRAVTAIATVAAAAAVDRGTAVKRIGSPFYITKNMYNTNTAKVKHQHFKSRFVKPHVKVQNITQHTCNMEKKQKQKKKLELCTLWKKYWIRRVLFLYFGTCNRTHPPPSFAHINTHLLVDCKVAHKPRPPARNIEHVMAFQILNFEERKQKLGKSIGVDAFLINDPKSSTYLSRLELR